MILCCRTVVLSYLILTKTRELADLRRTPRRSRASVTTLGLAGDLLKMQHSVRLPHLHVRSELVSDAGYSTFGYDLPDKSDAATNFAQCVIDPDDENGECLTCKRVTKPTKSTLNCLRYTVTDASLYREQDKPFHMWSRRWSNMDLVDIQDWADAEVKTVTISQIFLDAPYDVRVRKFIPQAGDMIEDAYCLNGKMRKYRIPQYALASLEETATMFQNFIEVNVGRYINGAIGQDKCHPVIWTTYLMAFRHLRDVRVCTLHLQTPNDMC